MIWLIEQLWIDSLENDYASAMGYSPVGYVQSESDAHRIIIEGGVYVGTGWPVESDTRIQRLRAKQLGLMK